MLRPIDRNSLESELTRMHEVDDACGVPLLEGYLKRIMRDGRVARNDQIYQLYEVQGQIRGYYCVIPLHAGSYWAFIEGPRCTWRDFVASDMLSAADYTKAIHESQPLHLWIESLAASDPHAFQVTGDHFADTLSKFNIAGVIVESSSTQSETLCRFLGCRLVREYDPCPTGIRKIWMSAGREAPRGWPYGPPEFELGLTPAERKVAALFYCPFGHSRLLTDQDIARSLRIEKTTVKTHLSRIRDKAETAIGTSDRQLLCLWFYLHPGELAINDGSSKDHP